ncbi:hypothetical protein GCM10010182_76760 [Actinomadura cremea]|nr:hypothetical protein GCM10010182_76760 [Actinomadura cremea]
METKTWAVEIYINEDGADTVARAVLFTGADNRTVGQGRARRNPADPEVPEIGDELAVSRALADLAGRLRGVAGDDIDRLTSPA